MSGHSKIEDFLIETISIPTYFNEHLADESKGITKLNDLTGTATLCPFHDDVNPSFRFWKAKKMFMCFGCKKSGDVINLHRLTLQRNTKHRVTRDAAIKDLCKLYNIRYEVKRKTNVETGATETVVEVDPTLKDDGTHSRKKPVVVTEESVFDQCRNEIHLGTALAENRRHFNLLTYQQQNRQIRDNANLSLAQKFQAYARIDMQACIAISATNDRYDVAANMSDLPT